MEFKKFFLILIFLVAAFLRFYKLQELPPGFHVDEVIVGYNAYSLMKTGRDENGNFLPLYIDSFGDFRPAGYFYLTIPVITIFGLNEFAVRFSAALFGVLSVILVYFLTWEIFQKKLVALIAALLLAISPWHIIVSRATSETSVALFLILAGSWLFLRALRKGDAGSFLPPFLLFFTSYYFYHTPRLFVPILILGIIVLSWQKIKSLKTKTMSIIFLASCLLASFLVIFFGPGTGRFKQVSVFNNPGVQLRLDEQIREEFSGTNIYLVRFFHNKAVNYAQEIISNYGKHFSLDFLFLKGGLPIRYQVPEMGLLYLVELPFILLGLIIILKKKADLLWLPIYWLLTGPMAASLTQEDLPNIQRAFFMLPSFQILAAYGFYESAVYLKKKNIKLIIIGFLVLGVVFNFSYFLHQYFVHQRVHRPWYRNYGFKQLVSALDKFDPDYKKIIITKSHNDPYIYILFYKQYDPRLYQQYRALRLKDKWGFEKYIFHPSDCPSHQKEEVFQEEKTLFVDKGECQVLPYARVLETISREDNTPVFRLLEIKKQDAEAYFKQQEKLTLKEGEEK